MRSWKGGFRLWLCAMTALLMLAAPTPAAATVYPSGGGQFNGGPERWEVTGAGCDVPVLCSAGGGYDGSAGSPPGSFTADTTISLNLLALFHSTVTLQSPDFVVGEAGPASLHLERQFDNGSLVDLAPELDYSVQLLDRTAGKRSTVIAETIRGSSGWSGEDGTATVEAGHTYAILITARTSSTVAGTGLLAGSTRARFDNVALTVHGPGSGKDASAGGRGARGGATGGAGGGDGAGGNSLAARLAEVAPAALVGSAEVKGKRLLVRARCPKKVGRACRISLLGLLKKSRPATTRRTVKVPKGKARLLVLKVKPGAKAKVALRKRLLFKVQVRAGSARATAYRRLRLIRR
jgi:hypothetical protein